ncbi:MAG: hydrogenase [Kiritimatiellae bacterium]|nr:hydrogenase [Kiritimatiellia bacterium]
MNTLLILILLTNLRLLVSSRIHACVRWVAAQGILLGLLAVVGRQDHITLLGILFALFTAAIKGWVFPWLIFRAIRESEIRREMEPYVGYNLSLAIGLAALGVSFWLGRRLPLPGLPGPLFVPVAFFSMFAGLFLIVSRKKAVTQALGYLVMENGIYLFGVVAVRDEPLLVELGVLLDLLVAVFVMGITMFHIQRDVESLDADQLTQLRD